jgi:hypothetical protein
MKIGAPIKAVRIETGSTLGDSISLAAVSAASNNTPPIIHEPGRRNL